MVAAKEKKLIEFNSWKYKRYLEFFSSESKTIEVDWTLQAENKTFPTGTFYFYD